MSRDVVKDVLLFRALEASGEKFQARESDAATL
jgi:hypothetical protein